jgi:hypothetical protein
MSNEKPVGSGFPWAALFWPAVATVVVGILVVDGARTTRLIFSGTRARATVVGTHQDEHVVGQMDREAIVPVTVAEYEFPVDGRRVRGTTEGEVGSWKIGDRLEVRFRPDDPTQNQAVRDASGLQEMLFLLVVFAGPFLYFTVKSNYPALRTWWLRHETRP